MPPDCPGGVVVAVVVALHGGGGGHPNVVQNISRDQNVVGRWASILVNGSYYWGDYLLLLFANISQSTPSLPCKTPSIRVFKLSIEGPGSCGCWPRGGRICLCGAWGYYYPHHYFYCCHNYPHHVCFMWKEWRWVGDVWELYIICVVYCWVELC